MPACPPRERPVAKPHTDILPSLFANALNFIPPQPTRTSAWRHFYGSYPSSLCLSYMLRRLCSSLLSALYSALDSGLCCYRRSNSLQQQIPSGKVSPETDGPRSPSVVYFFISLFARRRYWRRSSYVIVVFLSRSCRAVKYCSSVVTMLMRATPVAGQR